MTQDQAKRLQGLTENIVTSRIALLDAQATAKSAQCQYDQYLSQIVQGAESGQSLSLAPASPAAQPPTAPAPTPISWLNPPK